MGARRPGLLPPLFWAKAVWVLIAVAFAVGLVVFMVKQGRQGKADYDAVDVGEVKGYHGFERRAQEDAEDERDVSSLEMIPKVTIPYASAPESEEPPPEVKTAEPPPEPPAPAAKPPEPVRRPPYHPTLSPIQSIKAKKSGASSGAFIERPKPVEEAAPQAQPSGTGSSSSPPSSRPRTWRDTTGHTGVR